MFNKSYRCTIQISDDISVKEDEDKEEEVHSGSEVGEEEEVDVVTVERIPALCSR